MYQKDRIELYRTMLDISRELDLPRFFKTDVTKHDRDEVMRMDDGGDYYWVLRDSASHFFSSDDLCAIRPALRNMTVRAVFHIRAWINGTYEIREIPVGLFFTNGILK